MSLIFQQEGKKSVTRMSREELIKEVEKAKCRIGAQQYALPDAAIIQLWEELSHAEDLYLELGEQING